MRFITVASKKNKGLDLLQQSCDHFGVDLEILGFGEPYHGNGTKIYHLTNFLEKVDTREIILFTDAYDSFLVRDVKDLESEFQKMDHPVIFSAEDNYYFRIQAVQNLFLNPYYRLRYPKSESLFAPYRYLNSGGYMGRAGALLEVFRSASVNRKSQSDQVNLHRYFVNNPGKIKLDYDHSIFTNYGKFADSERFDVTNDELTNLKTNTRPFIFHFPGPKHRGLWEFAEKFSFLMVERP